MEIKIDGMERVLTRLHKLEDCSKAVELGLLKGGQRIEGTAKLLCPVDTGALRQSIHTEKRAPRTVYVFTVVEYAAPVEFGTGALGDPKVPHTAKRVWHYKDEDGKWHTCHGQRAQPFFQPSFNQNSDFVVKSVQQEMKKSTNMGGVM